jgi:archaellin
MSIALHVATIALMPVNSAGVVVNKNQATIKEMMRTSSEMRVISDVALPNTANNPTVADYLELEAADGFILNHLDQTYIITYGSV